MPQLYLEHPVTKKRFYVVKLRKDDQGTIVSIILKGPAGVEFEQPYDMALLTETLGYVKGKEE